jgi:hypothetical protein
VLVLVLVVVIVFVFVFGHEVGEVYAGKRSSTHAASSGSRR